MSITYIDKRPEVITTFTDDFSSDYPSDTTSFAGVVISVTDSNGGAVSGFTATIVGSLVTISMPVTVDWEDYLLVISPLGSGKVVSHVYEVRSRANPVA